MAALGLADDQVNATASCDRLAQKTADTASGLTCDRFAQVGCDVVGAEVDLGCYGLVQTLNPRLKPLLVLPTRIRYSTKYCCTC